jgi:signal transduction histidine kinase
MRMKDGPYRWHVSRAVPVTRADGSVRWFGTATDIEQLQQALNAKDEFLALVSHDLRSPLTTILGSASLLRRGLFQTDEDRTEAALEIENKARQLAQTIDELIELSRLQGLPRPYLAPIPIAATVQNAVTKFQETHPCEISVECSNSVQRVYGHEPYILRTLDNLHSNAWKYGNQGPIDVQIEPDNDAVAVRVQDRGIGIDEDDAARVFDPFYRGSNAAGIRAGLGIGLTLCQRLVEAQGGQIGAAPRPGGGSTFWFSLQRTDGS